MAHIERKAEYPSLILLLSTLNRPGGWPMERISVEQHFPENADLSVTQLNQTVKV